MALTRPIFVNGLQVEDATNEIIIRFRVGNNSSQVVSHKIEIYENTTGVLAYSNTTVSFMLENRVPANSLVNGREYRIQVKTYDRDNNESQWSDYMILKCYTSPTVEVVNIPIDTTGNRVIRNQTYIFEGRYSQKENVGIKSYRFKLLDADKVSLKIFDAVYTNDPYPLSQEITSLCSKEKYYIQIITLNQANIESSSELLDFYVDYEETRITNVLDVQNDKENALVNISAQIIQMLLVGEGNYKFEEYATYTRERLVGELNPYQIGKFIDMDIKEFTTERMVEPLGEYSEGVFVDKSKSATYSITTNPNTLQDLFFIDLEAEGAKVWIDNEHGLNMRDRYTMNIWAESILENKQFLIINGKNSITKFSIYDNMLHCIEDVNGMVRHSTCEISRYSPLKPIHIFIQKDTYMRLKARVMY